VDPAPRRQQAADADTADESIKALQNCISLLETYSQKSSDAAKASMHAGAEYAKNLKTFGHFLSNVDSKVKDVYQKHSQKYGELHADQQKIFSSLIQQLQEYKEKLPQSEATGEDKPATEAGDGPAPQVLAQTSFAIQDAPPESALQEAEENLGSKRKHHHLQDHKAEPSSHLEVHHKGHLSGKKHHAAGHHNTNSSKSHAAGHHNSHHHKANSSKSHAASHLEVVEHSHEKKHGHGGAHHEAHKAKHKKHGHHSDHLSQASKAHPVSFMQLSGHHHRHRKRKRTRAAKHRHQKHKHEEDDESNKVVDIMSVDNVCDVGNGEPLFSDFAFEDWALMSLRFEFYLLVKSFKRDVNDFTKR